MFEESFVTTFFLVLLLKGGIMMRPKIKRKRNCEIRRSLMYNIGGNFDCEALKFIAYKIAMEGTMG